MTSTQKQGQNVELDNTPTLEELRNQQEGWKERRRVSSQFPVTNEKGKKHLKKMSAPKEDEGTDEAIWSRAMRAINRPQKEIKHVIEYKRARALVGDLVKVILHQLKREPVFSEEDRRIYRNLTKYFIGDPTCEWDLNKGLYLWGPVGCGKTFALNVMRVFAEAAKIDFRRFKMVSCPKISDDVQAAKDIGVINRYFDEGFCFDDLGDEPTELKNYGNEVLVMVRILTERYRRGVNSARTTHVTSNYPMSHLEEFYGTRVADRAREMFTEVFFDGKSKRV